MRRPAGPAGFSRIERELAHEEAGGDAADRGGRPASARPGSRRHRALAGQSTT